MKNFPVLPTKEQWKTILLISKTAAYHNQNDYRPIKILVCDDAGQFKKITELIQLCWIHSGRNFKLLSPYAKRNQQILKDFLDDFWDYYQQLESYRQAPDDQLKQKLNEKFDELFGRKTGFEQLDSLLRSKLEKKAQYLTVLDYPEVPIHNNHSEQQIKAMVTKRKISSGTRSDEGRDARDTFTGLMLTCKKHSIDFLKYLIDRLSGKMEIPPLSDLIRQKVKAFTGYI